MSEKDPPAETAGVPSVLPSEAEALEANSVAIQRTTTETLYQKRTIEVVVPIDAPLEALALEDIKGKPMLHALVNERDFWCQRAGEKEEAISVLTERVTKLTEANGELKSKNALAENNLEHASGSNWIEGVLFGLGGVLVGMNWSASPVMCGLGLLMIAAAGLHSFQRKRSLSKKERS